MKGGTYARAKEVGFTDKQAQYLTMLSISVREEVAEEVALCRKTFHQKLMSRIGTGAVWGLGTVVVMYLGALIGLWLGLP